MTNNTTLLNRINLDQFELAPSQVWGNIRLVPVIKRSNTRDLRLGLRHYEDPYAVTYLDDDGSFENAKTCYYSYIPSAMIANWENNGGHADAYGCQLEEKSQKIAPGLRAENRIAKREGQQQLRFMPLHLAMEGFLGLNFSGPDFKWDEYTDNAIRKGLEHRQESSVSGYHIQGFDDALRVFEIHPCQVGVIVFVADALASIFITPHSSDYHAMHKSLLSDFYGEVLFHYGEHLYTLPELTTTDTMDKNITINDFDGLHTLIESTKKAWRAQHEGLLNGVIDRRIDSKIIKRLGKYRLQRFSTDFDTNKPNFIGEAITGKDGAIEYLKTYQLSKTQARRAYILHALARNDWNLEATGQTIGCTPKEVIRRLDCAGFGYLIKQHILEAALR